MAFIDKANPKDIDALKAGQETYGDSIYLNPIQGIDSSAWPYGAQPNKPCKTISNVLAIMAATGIITVEVTGSLTLDQDIPDDIIFKSPALYEHPAVLSLNSKELGNAVFRDLYVTGPPGSGSWVIFSRCTIGPNITYMDGVFFDCIFESNISGIVYMLLRNCSSFFSNVELSMAAGPNYISAVGLKGLFTIADVAHAGASVDILHDGGTLTVDASCIDGAIKLRGKARVTNNTGGAAVDDSTTEAELDTILGLLLP